MLLITYVVFASHPNSFLKHAYNQETCFQGCKTSTCVRSEKQLKS